MTTSVWSATNKSVLVTLDGTGLIASTVVSGSPTGNCGTSDAATNAVINNGDQKYWEVQYNSPDGSSQIGIANLSFNATINNFLGSDANSIGYGGDGAVILNNVTVATLTPLGNGDIVGIAVVGGSTIQFNRNGGAFSATINIAAITGQVFPAYRDANTSTMNVSANFGATAFAGVPLSGFTGFDSVPAPVTAPVVGGGFRHIGRVTRDELEPVEEAVTEATTEELPVKPPSRKMRKRLAAAKKQPVLPPVDDEEEEEAMMIGLAA